MGGVNSLKQHPRSGPPTSILQWWSPREWALDSPRFVPAMPGRGLRVSLRAAPDSTIPEGVLVLPPATRRGKPASSEHGQFLQPAPTQGEHLRPGPGALDGQHPVAGMPGEFAR